MIDALALSSRSGSIPGAVGGQFLSGLGPGNGLTKTNKTACASSRVLEHIQKHLFTSRVRALTPYAGL